MNQETKDISERQSASDLLRRNQVLESRLRDLENTLEKIASSTSWKVTSPLRFLGRVKRALTPLFRNRTYEVSILNVQHLERDGDTFTINGPTPHIIFEATSKRPISFWISLSYKFNSPEDHLSFAFYYDLGRGFLGEHRRFITCFNDQHETEVVNLKGQAFKFRLDPFSREGSFSLKDLKIKELGKAEVASKFTKKHFNFISLNPSRIFKLGKKAFAVYKEGGLTALKIKIFADHYTNNYAEWVQKYDTLTDIDKAAISRAVQNLTYQPLISVIMPTYNTAEEWLRKAIESVRGQLYQNWELCIADDCSTQSHVQSIIKEYASKDLRIKTVYRDTNGQIGAASNSALSLATGDYVAFLDHDDELTPHALYMIVDAINKNPDGKLFYSDEDKITTYGMRLNPYFKSDWNRELFLSQNYICHLTVCKADLVRKVGAFRPEFTGSQDWDLLLRVIEQLTPKEIIHLPFVLYHWRVIPESVAHGSGAKPYAIIAAKKAITEHLQRVGESGEVEIIESLSQLKVKFKVPDQKPLVSLIILTRDKLKLLKKCVNSILAKTEYSAYEIIIVDNGSVESDTLDYLDTFKENPKVKVLKIDEPFNFSRLNNLAVKEASGEILGFLNNDLEIITDDWLSEMVSHVVRDGVGAVGARLWFPNNLIQHAGVILGIGGIAGHGNKGIERGNPGYFNRAVLTQNFSAVTAACMLVARNVFDEVNGFNERDLSVAFNDVDFCLRLGEKGYRIVYTPYAELYHYESASRGYENTPKKFSRFEREAEYMKDKYKDILMNDPFYNPNLTLFNEDFSFAFPPRVGKPWRKKDRESKMRSEQ